jgi:two-component system chemotaxis response regulator CheB
MIKVLIVEDSLVVQEFLVHVLGADPDIQIIGRARNGEEAIEMLKNKRADVITMDINMPRMDGFEATRRIMETMPTPIVIVSGSYDPKEVSTTFRAIGAGAVAVLPRPLGIGHKDHAPMVKELVQTVKLMSEVRVVKRWARSRAAEARQTFPAVSAWSSRSQVEARIVAIGASTGGPFALREILSPLPKDFPLPVVVVQHMARGFIQGFVDWLSLHSSLRISIPGDWERIEKGRVYIAPDGFHMKVDAGGRIRLDGSDSENGLRPAVSFLFRSVAEAYGPRAVGVLLTGMGKDGAEELLLMKSKGAITIAQDRESSVVFGMPGEAMKIGAATYTLPPDRIAAFLAGLARK